MIGVEYYQKTFHRILLEKKLRENRHLLFGRVLDVGSKNRRYDHLFKGDITAIDLVSNPARNIMYGNIEAGTEFPDQSFDGILCLEVFEYLENIESAITEIDRLLVAGGRILLSIPFLNHEHFDKKRYSRSYLEQKFSIFSSVNLQPFGNGFTLLWDILRLKSSKLESRVLRYGAYLLLLPYLVLVKLSRLDRKKDDYPCGFFLIAEKR
jgi:SAM-dependent methyltransferase